MITTPTVLILGAGASKPYGFPTGSEFKDEIIGRERENIELDQFLRSRFGDNRVTEFKRALHLSSRPSVDAFLETRDEFLDIGKAAIVHALIPYEDRARIKPAREQRWYEYLHDTMLRDVGPHAKNYIENQLSIVTLNYDRSLEYFLWMALKHTYGLENNAALELVQKLPIVHVYGQLGSLNPTDEDHNKFSGKLTDKAMNIGINNIRIYTVEPDLPQEWEQAHHLIKSAQKVCFLGFGYHKSNVERLRINELFDGQLMGTILGFNANERNRLLNLFSVWSQRSTNKPIFKNENIMNFLKRRPVFED